MGRGGVEEVVDGPGVLCSLEAGLELADARATMAVRDAKATVAGMLLIRDVRRAHQDVHCRTLSTGPVCVSVPHRPYEWPFAHNGP